MNPRLSVRGLSKRYGETPVLTDLDFVASPGETVAIIGRSGSGKTTLLRCLTLLDLPDRGDAYLDDQQYLASGVPLYEPWEIRRSIVLVFQDFNLFPNMTVLRNIALALEKSRGMSRREAQDPTCLGEVKRDEPPRGTRSGRGLGATSWNRRRTRSISFLAVRRPGPTVCAGARYGP